MKHIRVRYHKTEKKGILRSSPIFCIKTNSFYQVILDENKLLFVIKNIHQNRIIVKGGGDTKSRHVLLRKVRQKLQKLGVDFGLEIRSV